MTDEQKNEEAHGLWEIAVARLAAVAEVLSAEGVSEDIRPSELRPLVKAERDAFAAWQEVSKRVTR